MAGAKNKGNNDEREEMKDNWTEQMKQKLEGHKMTPPEGLWEGISHEMGLESTSAPQTTHISRWLWAAAAVVLALVGFFAFYQFDDNTPQLAVRNEKASVVTSKPVLIAHTPVIDKEQTVTKKPVIKKQTVVPINQQESDEPIGQIAVGTILQEVAETNQQDEIEVNQQESADTKVLASTEKKQTSLPEPIEPSSTYSKSDDSEKWAIGLTGSNGLLMAANNFTNSMDNGAVYISSDVIENTCYYGGLLDQVNVSKEAVPKHHIPVRFGLSLQYQLNEHVALLTGVTYSYQKSEFNVPQYKNLGYDQKLTYLGVPLGVSWKIWSASNFNIYLSGETLIEKCVKANRSDDEICQRPWQWSVNASIGAEYHFTRQFGLYLEPSLGYYFDDGTDLEHYYKEHPLAPSIQFGLRLHLK